MVRRTAGSSDFFSVDEVALLSEGLSGWERGAERLRLLRLQSAWGRVVGAHLRAVARPSGYRSSCLLVEVRDSAWKRELDRLAPEILPRLSRLLPSHPVSEIRFRVRRLRDEAEPAAPPGAASPTVAEGPRAPAVDLTADLSVPAERVPDGALRDRLGRVMRRYLAGSV